MFNIFKKKPTNELNICEGDRFYSKYFMTTGTVTKFISDSEWYFILDLNKNSVYKDLELRAKAKPTQLEWIYRKGEQNETN